MARHFSGVGDPNGVVFGDPGDIYQDETGGATSTFWTKESGVATNTGWVTGVGTTGSFTFVWRPGSALVGPVVWDDFTLLYAALDAIRTANSGGGAYVILFDDSGIGGAVMNMPAGTYDMTGTAWRSYHGGFGASLTLATVPLIDVDIANGTDITHLTSITGLHIDGEGLPAAVITLGDNETLTLSGSHLESGDDPNSPIISATGNPCKIILADETLIGFNNPESGGVIEAEAGSSLFIMLDGAGCYLFRQSVFGDGAVTIAVEAAGSLVGNQPSLTTPPTFRQFVGNYYSEGQLEMPETSPHILPAINDMTFSGDPYPLGRAHVVKNNSGGALVINPDGTDTIDGAASFTLPANGDSVIFISDGIDNWRVTAVYIQ